VQLVGNHLCHHIGLVGDQYHYFYEDLTLNLTVLVTVTSMPAKSGRSAAQRQQLSSARSSAGYGPRGQPLTLEELLVAAEGRIGEAEAEITALRGALKNEQVHSRELGEALEQNTTIAAELAHQLSVEKEYSAKWYHALHVVKHWNCLGSSAGNSQIAVATMNSSEGTSLVTHSVAKELVGMGKGDDEAWICPGLCNQSAGIRK
jgi:hypothetical protein